LHSTRDKKLDKTRITANLCCNEDGTDKLPIGLLVMLHDFTQNRILNPENFGHFLAVKLYFLDELQDYA
jgi:hypothetical protein